MPRREPDAGAAAVEFVLISVLLLLLLFGVVQVGVYFYERNVIEASVADAARYAASAGVPAGAAERRLHELVETSLGSEQADAIHCHAADGRDGPSRLPVVTVRCTGHARALVAPIDIPMPITLTSSALKERLP